MKKSVPKFKESKVDVLKKMGGSAPHQNSRIKPVIREFTGTRGMEPRYLEGQSVLIPFFKEMASDWENKVLPGGGKGSEEVPPSAVSIGDLRVQTTRALAVTEYSEIE